MYFLGHHPDIQEELYQEIIKELGDSVPDFENIKLLSLCHNVIKESLRLRPVVPVFTRISPTDQILNNHRIVANVCIFLYFHVFSQIITLICSCLDSHYDL